MSNFTRYNVSYGLNQPLNLETPVPVVANRAPTTADKFPIGQIWVFKTANSVYVLTTVVNNLANWELLTTIGGPGIFNSLTVNPGPTLIDGLFTLASGAGNTAHIADDATDHGVILGSTTGASDTIIQGGTTGIFLGTAVTGAIIIGAATQTGAILLGAGTVGQNIQIGTGAGATNAIGIGNGAGATNQISIGNTTAATVIDLNAGVTNGIFLNGSGTVTMASTTASEASPTATVTINTRVGEATFTGFTTAAAGSQVFVINNATIVANSAVFVTVSNLGTNDAQMTLTRVLKAAGVLTITAVNNGGAALNGDVLISFWNFQ